MTASPWPNHLLTLDEFFAMPEDNSRIYELVEGVLQVTPRPVPRHQWALNRLNSQLLEQLPADWAPLMEVDVVVERTFPPTVRAPDLVVVRDEVLDRDTRPLDAQEVGLVVEIVSQGSRLTDNLTKRAQYAGVGIPFYWIITLQPEVTLAANELDGQVYRQSDPVAGTFQTESPFPLAIDLNTLRKR